MQVNSVGAGQGAGWFKCGWDLFKQDFGTWLIMFLLFIALSIVLSFIPFIGSAALMIISPALLGGFMYAAAEMDKGNSINIGHLFEGFREKDRMYKLLKLGAIYLLAQFLIMAVMVSLVGGNAMTSASETGEFDPQTMMTSGMAFSMLFVFLIGAIIMFGFIYATPLVMLDNSPPLDAIKASYSAGFKNMLPLLVFGLVYILLAIVAAIPFGLGFLLLIPVSMLALYCSYKSIFNKSDPAHPAIRM